jgi:hypothetical protein
LTYASHPLLPLLYFTFSVVVVVITSPSPSYRLWPNMTGLRRRRRSCRRM